MDLAVWRTLVYVLYCCFTEAKQNHAIFLIRMASATVRAITPVVQISNAPIMLSGFV